MGGTFTTVSTVTQTINVPTFGGIDPGFNINGLTLPQQYQLQAGDYVQVQITATAGRLCLVNEYPIGGTDTDATHIVLQTAPSLTISKSSAVVSDPVNGTSNPKRIPGAVIRYSIGVANAANASGTAESVTFTDPIPNNLTYLPSTIVIDGTAQTDAVDADSASFQSNSVNVSPGNIAPGVSHTIRFDATIN